MQEAGLMNAMPCIVCDKPLVNAMHNVRNQPSYGVAFVSHGHYGSGVFDPMDRREAIEVNVCDECLLKKADRVLHRREIIMRAENYEYKTLAECEEHI